MSTHKLGQRVHDDIGAVLDRSQQHWRCHRIVHNERDAVPVRHLRQCFDIADVAGRIADALAEDGARLSVDQSLNRFRMIGLGKMCCHTLSGQNMREQRMSRAVQLRR